MAGVFAPRLLPNLSPIAGFQPKSDEGAMYKNKKLKNMHDFVLFIHKIVHKLAGVAGFEPTNDGVRGKLTFRKIAVFARF